MVALEERPNELVPSSTVFQSGNMGTEGLTSSKISVRTIVSTAWVKQNLAPFRGGQGSGGSARGVGSEIFVKCNITKEGMEWLEVGDGGNLGSFQANARRGVRVTFLCL